MKIAVINPKSDFTFEQQSQLSSLSLGNVVYTETRDELSLEKLLDLVKGAEILAVDPDPLGGFEKAKLTLTKIIDSLPNLKAICLSTTSFGWIDLDYCQKRNVPVSNCPGWSRESVAEHALALLLALAKRIIVTDRKTQQGKYKLEMGFELKGKTLGIIGLGNIGSRIAELGNCLGMNVIAYNRSPKTQKDVAMKSLDEVLSQSDAISINTTHEPVNKKLLGGDQITKMKDGIIIVNLADRDLFDEETLAVAIKSGKVAGYAYEGNDLNSGPLAKLENVIGLKGFGWYTKEALTNLFELWVKNIAAAVAGEPQNLVN